MKLFGEKNNPREKLRSMISVIRRQKYKLQRDIDTLHTQNKRVEADIKKRAKAGNVDEAKILAKELVNSRKAVSRMRAAGAHMDCIVSELNCQAATNKLAGTLKSSTGVMKAMSALIKLPDLQKTMGDLSKEMTKMGLIEEMVQDTMESVMGDPDEMEEATSAEVNKILSEIGITDADKAQPALALDSVPAGEPIATGSVEEDDQEELAEMRARLAALRN